MEGILDNLSLAAKSLQVQTTKITRHYHVTIAEWRLLRQIDAKVITQDSMADALQLDTSTLSRQLKSLTTKELASKTAVGKDRRQLEYALTLKGQETLKNINQGYDALIDAVFHYWPEDEQQMMKIMLNRLNRSLDRASGFLAEQQK
ncbi:MarR family winged helix-turn-helix transcriptional regulator [Secundilactobacillus folii]|uniref:MarR family transcriptional regulator n=1 Tax=Secundilactobacillus folii TaxID=2678357 RepID=A0A7X2XU70_9LACO|nr:MarR family transcriptional regulator [Secundilactobacillus folii]MTV81160.1 MarR family transcriptional regulator [Secundilactobacillus folii]